MSRIILLILPHFVYLISSAQFLSDTIPHYQPSPPESKFKPSFTWFELGRTIPVRESPSEQLPSDLNAYFSSLRGATFYSFFGVGLYYKNRLGLSLIYSSTDFNSSGSDFANYLANEYPNYYTPPNISAFSYSMNHFVYRLGYRFHTKSMVIEPQLQFGINDYSSFDQTYLLKEKGSNHFITYSIQSENLKRNQVSYRAGTVIRWRYSKAFWKWELEPGIRFDFALVPTDYLYIIHILPYNMPATTRTVHIKQWNPSFAISLVTGVIRK